MAVRQFIENLHGASAFQGFAVEEELYRGDSQFQSIEIVQTERFGKVLILDGVVQTTELDEFIYHEMLVHVPMCACATPRDVLIIGGGDGGALREALRHDVARVDIIEIDEQVVSSCIDFMPTLNNAGSVFEDARTNLVIDDAFAYLGREKCRYDVIISDSTDPIGAAEILFSEEFYALCDQALKPNGVIALQNGVAFLQPQEAHNTMRALRHLGLFAKCYQVAVPTYYGGLMMLGFATREENAFNPSLKQLSERFDRIAPQLRHYTPEHHLASFALPQWAQAITGECNDSATRPL